MLTKLAIIQVNSLFGLGDKGMYYILGINHYIQYLNKEINIEVFTEFVAFVLEILEKKILQ